MQQWNITTLIVFYLFDWAETSFAALCFSYSNQFLSVLFLLKRFLSLKLSAFVWERLGVLPEYQLFVIFYLAYLWLKSLVQIFCFSYSNQFSPLVLLKQFLSLKLSILQSCFSQGLFSRMGCDCNTLFSLLQ